MKFYPSWKSNLALFLILIAAVAGYFFLQLEKASLQFQKHSREHSEVVAGVVELNLKNALTSSASLEDIYRGFLNNSARFLHYLDSIEPFSDAELTAFALESGLAGVKIIRHDNRFVTGPADWLPEQRCLPPDSLIYREEVNIYLLSYYPEGRDAQGADDNCIIVGVAAEGLDRIREALSLNQLLKVLNGLPGIAYVRFKKEDGIAEDETPGRINRDNSDGAISEHEIVVGENRLVVALEAEHYFRRIRQMQKELGLFVIFLLAVGSLTSWWLYRTQRYRLEQARLFERQLARQHEEAALGRAASTITHELRNPLNAIGIGLQRLQFEAGELSGEHRQLLASMREAVDRSNSVISRLRQYIHNFRVEGETLDLKKLIDGVMALYRNKFEDQSIDLSLTLDSSARVKGDRDLLGQLIDNLLRNALEAQPEGGFLRITLDRSDRFWRLSLENGGLSITSEQSEHLFEPYFTTKAKGTGLGLSISKKIVEAHQGTIDWNGGISENEFRLTILLPGITVHN